MRTIVLDNEAVQALAHHGHPKHRTVLAHLAGVVARRQRSVDVNAVVATTVRVEAGWDRSHPRSSGINRMRILDLALGTEQADTAAEIVRRTGVSVADSHVGAIVAEMSGQVVVLSSDPDDMVRVCEPRVITAIRI